MSKRLPAALLMFFLSIGAFVGTARAADPEFTMLGGATSVSFDDDFIDNEWGVWLAPSFSFSPVSSTPEFRLGAGVSFAWVSVDTDSDTGTLFNTGDADLYLITPELLISWRQPIGDHFYLEPGIGVGAVIGLLDSFGTESDVGYSIRPYIRAGYDAARWSAGMEAAYRFGQLDLGGGSSDLQNFSIGVFISFNLG
jgi:hypothetical protein